MLIGESEEDDAAGHLTISVLRLGKAAGLGLEELLGNIHKVFAPPCQTGRSVFSVSLIV